jgi:hypothetical protein
MNEVCLWSATPILGEWEWSCTTIREKSNSALIGRPCGASRWTRQQTRSSGHWTWSRSAEAQPRACIVVVYDDEQRVRPVSLAPQALLGACSKCDWLVAVRVPGVLNTADAPSRNKPLRADHVLVTWQVLRCQLGSVSAGKPTEV